jgi:ABC-2 type transport system permease protein
MLSWFAFPFVVAFIALFGFGMAMLLSSLFVRFRDIEPIWDVIIQAMFYASAIFFPLSLLGSKLPSGIPAIWWYRIILANPFATGLEEARHVFISPTYGTPSSYMGGIVWLAIPVGITLAAVVMGFRIFCRTAPTIAEDL